MEEIIDFKNYLLAEYPETWAGVDDFIKKMIPHKEIPLFTPYESKYYKEFVPKITGSKVIYIPLNKADDQAKKYRGLFSLNFIDYEELFNDFDKFYFDTESWSNNRRTNILKKVNEFLFECNTFKGVSFFKVLGQTILEIQDRLANLENIDSLYNDKPNWLQLKIKESLELEIKTIKNILISNYELVYPKLNSLFVKSDLSLIPSSSFAWYKIAQLMATGYLKIENQHYIVENKIVYNESEAARQVSTHLHGNDGKFSSIASYLNQTKQNVPNENKNIFIYSRINDLKNIANEVSQLNNLSEYFKVQIDKLEKENTF